MFRVSSTAAVKMNSVEVSLYLRARVTCACFYQILFAQNIGGYLASSLGGREKIFADQIFEWPFFWKYYHFNANISDDLFSRRLFFAASAVRLKSYYIYRIWVLKIPSY